MKKTFYYIVLMVVGIAGMLQLSSCKNDDNDWSVDSSVTKQYPPTALEIVSVDSATLEMQVKVNFPSNAPQLQLQVSESPLTSNDAIAVTGQVYDFYHQVKTEGYNGYTFTIPRTGNSNGFVVKENTTYYFRARCIKDGTISNWYTTGMLYNGGVSDPTLEQKLIKNTYDNVNAKSYVATPATAWVDDASVGETSLTIRWIKPDYATPTTLVNVTTGVEQDITNASLDPAYTKTKVQYYEWTDLTPGQEYTFNLLDGNRNVIGTFTKATETAPVKSLAYFIGNFPDFGTTATDFTLKATDASGVEADNVTCTFVVAGKMKTQSANSKSAKDFPFTSPFNSTEKFWPLAPTATSQPESTVKAYRLQTGGNASYLKLNVPAKGRLYIYAYNSAKLTITQNGTSVEKSLVQTSAPNSTSTGSYTKAYVEAGEVTIKWSASIYICGIHYVPWEAIE